ncbi:MAG TPA: YidC/Oxa1 family membrane protein insertase [Candidatus Paceibacterota bacterium]|nr:YidC/Oxa1 family membrane protein insertase [Candidatus Paceibacterota bacterium]
MIGALFHTYLSIPIYNLLVFFIGIMPGGDVGLAVIAVTLVVKIIILPLSYSAVRTQRAMKVIEPELAAIKEKFKNDSGEQAREQFALYKKYKINPFASFFTLLIQLPILLALYWVFRGEALPAIDVTSLYSFVSIPVHISTQLLGVFLVVGKSITLAVLAGITQYLQAVFAIPTPPKTKNGGMTEDFGRAMAMQARFVIPFIIALVSYETSGAVALYFVTSNIVTLFQEFLVRKRPLIPHTARTVEAVEV